MDPFVDQLADLCRAQVTRSKWVFVPTHSIGRTLGERIAREGTNWLNLRFVTPRRAGTAAQRTERAQSDRDRPHGCSAGLQRRWSE